MSDAIDEANDLANTLNETALRHALKSHRPMPVGKCLNCEEPTKGSFCDTDCRDDWEKRQRASGRR